MKIGNFKGQPITILFFCITAFVVQDLKAQDADNNAESNQTTSANGTSMDVRHMGPHTDVLLIGKLTHVGDSEPAAGRTMARC
jgi:hypothetical protein